MFTTRITTTLAALTLGATIVPGAAARQGSSAAVPPCRTVDLSARLGRIDAGAGQRYETLALINHSRHTCHTYGFVGMQFLGAHGRALPTHVVRDHTYRAHRVVLAPGARAVTVLHWSAIPDTSDPNGRCGPAPRRVEVTPPDETTHLTIGWAGGAVCGHGRVSVTRLR